MRHLSISVCLLASMTALSSIPAASQWPPAPVEKSGQTLCYDVDGDPESCVGSGQDGELQAGVPLATPRFLDHGDGTVTDLLTGLIWLKNGDCNDGLEDWPTVFTRVAELNASGTMDGNDCGDTSNGGSFQTDWRVPNVKEVLSLIHYDYAYPALSESSGLGHHSEGDPFVNLATLIWTSTTQPGNGLAATFVDLSLGESGGTWKTNPRGVWAVRGEMGGDDLAWPAGPAERTGQITCYESDGDPGVCAGTGQDGDHLAGVPLPEPRFLVNGDGTVTDLLTGLVWLRNADCAGGQRSWNQAFVDVAQLNSSGSMNGNDCGDTSNGGGHHEDWRLPSVRELLSLINMEYFDPALSNASGTGQLAEGDPFSGVGVLYWSSTSEPSLASHSNALSFYMPTGFVSNGTKGGHTFSVWPVRGGPIFGSGFGSGDASQWSAQVPAP